MMKSAYELALERLRREDPEEARPLSGEQKSRLAEIDRRFRAKRAEREIFLRQKLEEARAGGDAGAVAQIERQMAGEMEQFDLDCEAEKEKVRGGC
jgi:hypothetical protein